MRQCSNTAQTLSESHVIFQTVERLPVVSCERSQANDFVHVGVWILEQDPAHCFHEAVQVPTPRHKLVGHLNKES